MKKYTNKNFFCAIRSTLKNFPLELFCDILEKSNNPKMVIFVREEKSPKWLHDACFDSNIIKVLGKSFQKFYFLIIGGGFCFSRSFRENGWATIVINSFQVNIIISLIFGNQWLKWHDVRKRQGYGQGGITCGAIDEPKKSSKAIDERIIINFRDKNVVIARFRDKNVYR